MRVYAILEYDRLVKVNVRKLRRLLAEGKIIAFRRSSGWVRVGTDRIRGDGGCDYPGPERREFRQDPPPEPRPGLHYCLPDKQ